MKKFTFILLSALLWATGCGSDKDTPDPSSHQHDSAAELYTCGMHPQIVQEGPGLCPICEMELVPLNQSSDGEGVVSIDPVTLQNIGVRSTEVVLASIQKSVRANGTVEIDERGKTAVSPKIGGWIEKLYVNYEGARVATGQKLLDIYSPELVSTQEEFLLALRNRERLAGTAAEPDAQRLLDAAQRRLSYWDISEQQIEQLRTSGSPQRTLSLYAPASGTVTALRVVEGERIQPGQMLMELSSLSTVWIMIDLYEQDLSWINVGSQARIELPYDTNFRANGGIDYIYDELNASTRTVKARIPVRNSGAKLKPGMYVIAQILGRPSDRLPVVPPESILRDGSGSLVLLDLGEGRFKPQPVTLGVETDSLVQVVSGVSEGDRVVTRAQFLIDSEARLQSAVSMMQDSEDQVQEDGMKNMRVDVYAADENRDGKVTVCMSAPYLVADSVALLSGCEGETRDLSIGASQTVLHYDGYRNVPVDVAHADHNQDGTVYQCPMDWAILHDSPGNCEVCNMKLEPFSVSEAQNNLTKEKYRLVGGR